MNESCSCHFVLCTVLQSTFALCFCLPVCLSVSVSVSLSVYDWLSVSVCLSLCLSLRLFLIFSSFVFLCLSVSVFLSVSLSLSVCLSVSACLNGVTHWLTLSVVLESLSLPWYALWGWLSLKYQLYTALLSPGHSLLGPQSIHKTMKTFCHRC